MQRAKYYKPTHQRTTNTRITHTSQGGMENNSFRGGSPNHNNIKSNAKNCGTNIMLTPKHNKPTHRRATNTKITHTSQRGMENKKYTATPSGGDKAFFKNDWFSVAQGRKFWRKRATEFAEI